VASVECQKLVIGSQQAKQQAKLALSDLASGGLPEGGSKQKRRGHNSNIYGVGSTTGTWKGLIG
jgi:hypothetical protein